MKVFRIDTAEGFYQTLTEKELHEQFDQEAIDELKSKDELWETKYTVKELKKARALHNDRDYCWEFEQEYGIQPSEWDLLKEGN